MSMAVDLSAPPPPPRRPSLTAFQEAGIPPESNVLRAFDRYEHLVAVLGQELEELFACRPREGAPATAPLTAGDKWADAAAADAVDVVSTGSLLASKSSQVAKLLAGDGQRLARVAQARAAVHLAARQLADARRSGPERADATAAVRALAAENLTLWEAAYHDVVGGDHGRRSSSSPDVVGEAERVLARWKAVVSVGDWLDQRSGRSASQVIALMSPGQLETAGLEGVFGAPRVVVAGQVLPAGRTAGFIVTVRARLGGPGAFPLVVDVDGVVLPDAELLHAEAAQTPERRAALRDHAARSEAKRAARAVASGPAGPSRRVRS